MKALMTSFSEANQAKLALKMSLHLHSFFKTILITSEDNEYSVIVFVDQLNDNVRKIVPNVHNGVSIKLVQAK